MKSVIIVTCPGCRGRLEVDVVNEKVVGHHRAADDEKDRTVLFDEVVTEVKEREKTAEDRFRAAQRNVADADRRIEELFGDVKKKIAEEKDKPYDPKKDRRPFDWD